jgi:Holliday junction resolvasome RuvABC endonuclease subunit
MISFDDDRDSVNLEKLPGSKKLIYHPPDRAYVYRGALAERKSEDKIGRIEDILMPVLDWGMHAHAVIIEGYSYGSQNMHAVAELGGIIRYHLRKIGQSPVDVAPTSLKKFITGSGAADKDQMLEAVQRAGVPIVDHNMADAYGLAQLGYALQLPDSAYLAYQRPQRETIHAIKYPVIKTKKRKEPKLWAT